MTTVRSLGVTTLVALMSAHRASLDQRGTAYDQDTVEAIDAYLRGDSERPTERRYPATEPPRSYN
jgi:hypothetical protein